jgi:RHS repeat-associated protein
VTTTSCDATSRANPSSATIADNQFSYDLLGRVASQTLVNAQAAVGPGSALNGSYGYQYDASGHIKQISDQDPATGSARTRKLLWDHDGNRRGFGAGLSYPTYTSAISCTGSATTACFTYNADDSIATGTDKTTGSSHTYSYTGLGNLKDDGTTSYCHDPFDRLSATGNTGVDACVAANAKTTQSYDGLDRQTQSATTGATGLTTNLYYDGNGSAVSEEARSGVGLATSLLPVDLLFVRDSTGGPLAAAGPLPADVQYLTDNGNGNLSAVTGTTNTQTPLCTARLDAFGTPQRPTITGTDFDVRQHTCSSGSTNSDLFFGAGRQDQATSTYQMGARTYDPAKAAFLTPDNYRSSQPAADTSIGIDPLSQNSYGYVNGDPVNLNDPDGHAGCVRIDDGNGNSSCTTAGLAAQEHAQAQRQAADAANMTQGYSATNRLCRRVACDNNDYQAELYSHLNDDNRASYVSSLEQNALDWQATFAADAKRQQHHCSGWLGCALHTVGHAIAHNSLIHTALAYAASVVAFAGCELPTVVETLGASTVGCAALAGATYGAVNAAFTCKSISCAAGNVIGGGVIAAATAGLGEALAPALGRLGGAIASRLGGTAAESTTAAASDVTSAGTSVAKAFNPAEIAGETDPKTVVAAAIRRADDLGDAVNQTVATVRVPGEPGFPGLGPVDDPGGLLTASLAVAAIIAKIAGRL